MKFFFITCNAIRSNCIDYDITNQTKPTMFFFHFPQQIQSAELSRIHNQNITIIRARMRAERNKQLLRIKKNLDFVEQNP